MRATLRAMERTLVRERAERHIGSVLDEFLPRWDEAKERDLIPEYEQAFCYKLFGCGLHLHGPAARTYISGCRGRGELPVLEHLISILIPQPIP